MSVSKQVTIGSSNGFLPMWHQAITRTSHYLLLISVGHLGQTSVKFESNSFIQENAYQNVIYKMGTILSV